MSDRGKAAMDRIRQLVVEMESQTRSSLDRRQAEWQDAITLSSRMTWGGSALLIFLIAIAGVVMSRDHRARETETCRAGQAGLSLRIQGEQRLEQLGGTCSAF